MGRRGGTTQRGWTGQFTPAREGAASFVALRGAGLCRGLADRPTNSAQVDATSRGFLKIITRCFESNVVKTMTCASGFTRLHTAFSLWLSGPKPQPVRSSVGEGEVPRGGVSARPEHDRRRASRAARQARAEAPWAA